MEERSEVKFPNMASEDKIRYKKEMTKYEKESDWKEKLNSLTCQVMWNKRLEFCFDSLLFYFFCDVGVKYLKCSKLEELVAKILINCSLNLTVDHRRPDTEICIFLFEIR